ncbi:MAG: hypothetical protein FMNOHCHN_03786 [Ignavibacteriaceae bacterium]|nr:hypothetical protein [Ignavibacteriaceae bacterium]
MHNPSIEILGEIVMLRHLEVLKQCTFDPTYENLQAVSTARNFYCSIGTSEMRNYLEDLIHYLECGLWIDQEYSVIYK